MALEKMLLQGYSDAEFSTTVGNPYYVFLNPDTLTLSNKNEYDTTSPQGAVAEAPRFNHKNQGTLNFSLLLDGTRTIDGRAIQVGDELEQLRALTLAYKSKSKSPNFVQVSWGKVDFKGRLTSFNVSVTMFRADGAPLRAKVDLAFISADTAAEADQKAVQAANKTVEQRRVVKAGDTLSSLCKDVYGSASGYMNVVKYNQLTNFTLLTPGTELIFPPMG